jgi:hypothetical protein
LKASDLPRLAEIFDQLRRGRHICREDGDIYWLLQKNRQDYEDLFTALGFRLEGHPREFFFFRGEGSLSKQASKMGLFFFILVEWRADRGDFVERELMDGEFDARDLPHLLVDRYRAAMREVEVMTPDDLLEVIKSMETFGFARRLEDDRFRLRTPAMRFVDLCHEMLRRDESIAEPKEQLGLPTGPGIADGDE